MVKCPEESVVEIFFVPFTATVAPGSTMPSLPVILPFIIVWENTELTIKKRKDRKKKINLRGAVKMAMLLINSFVLSKIRKAMRIPDYSFFKTHGLLLKL